MQSIETLCVVDEDTVITGSSDGLLRLVQLQPNKLLGVLGVKWLLFRFSATAAHGLALGRFARRFPGGMRAALT